MVVLKSSTTSFAIYRHQTKIFVVLADGLVDIERHSKRVQASALS